MKKITIVLATFSLSLLSTVAFAAEDADQAALQGPSEGGVSEYNFEDDSIEGELLAPEGENMGNRPFAGHPSLITIRANFVREMEQMAHDL